MGLSESDIKILMACLQPRTKQEISNKAGVPFSYCEKRIGKLRNAGLLKIDNTNGTFKYNTIRRPETEQLWSILPSEGESPTVFEFLFHGRMSSIAEAGNRVRGIKGKIKRPQLIDTIHDCVCALKVRSFRKFNALTSQPPTEKEYKILLQNHILATERELEFAKEILNTEVLWSGSETVWELISEGSPSEIVIKRYQDASKLYYSFEEITEENTKVVESTSSVGLTKEQTEALAEYQKQWKEEGWG